MLQLLGSCNAVPTRQQIVLTSLLLLPLLGRFLRPLVSRVWTFFIERKLAVDCQIHDANERNLYHLASGFVNIWTHHHYRKVRGTPLPLVIRLVLHAQHFLQFATRSYARHRTPASCRACIITVNNTCRNTGVHQSSLWWFRHESMRLWRRNTKA